MPTDLTGPIEHTPGKCRHREPVRFAAANLLLPPDKRDRGYCWCCGAWLAGAQDARCSACKVN